MLKLVLSIIGGLVVAFAVVFATEMLFHAFLSPPGVTPDSSDRDAMRRYVASQPSSALIAVLIGWALAAFTGSAVAARFSGRGRWPGWTVTGLFLLATAANFLMIEHPTWMVITAIASIVALGWIGARAGERWAGQATAGRLA